MGWSTIAKDVNAWMPVRGQYALGRIHLFARSLAERRVCVVLLRGMTASGRQGSMLLAGNSRTSYLPHCFFGGTPQAETLAEVPVFRLEPMVRKYASEADLTAICTDRFSSRLFFEDSYMVVPAWVGGSLDVPAELAALIRASHSVHEDMRVVRREGLVPEISRDTADFDLFYDNYYVPFTGRRHGEAAHLNDRCWLWRRFRTGGILWILRDGERIAGVQFGRLGPMLHLWAIGTLGGAPEPVKAGAFAALYYHSIELARRTGAAGVDFGGTRPSLDDGLLRYKRKWGVVLRDNPRNNYEFLVRVNRWNRTVTAFLSSTSLIYRDGRRLAALAAIDSDTPAAQGDADRVRHLLWMNGLAHLSIVSASGWRSGVEPPPQVSLVDHGIAGMLETAAVQR